MSVCREREKEKACQLSPHSSFCYFSCDTRCMCITNTQTVYVCMCVGMYKALLSNSSLHSLSYSFSETPNSLSSRTAYNLANAGPTGSAELLGSHFSLCHLIGDIDQVTWLSLSLSFVICKTEKNYTFSHWDVAKIKIIMHVSHSAWCLAHPMSSELLAIVFSSQLLW